MELITSAGNSKLKYIKSLLTKKGRDEHGAYTVEGIKSVRDAAAAGADIELVAVSESFSEELPSGTEIIRVADRLFPPLCDTKTPQGILCVIRKKKCGAPDFSGRYVYCDRLRDPGNLGTVIRTADAAGFRVLLSPECAELYSPKVVRTSMGSFFHIEVYENISYAALKDGGLKLIAGALGADSRDFREITYPEKLAVIVGNEANGVSAELLEMCDERVIIPIFGRAESLNAAVAAAILMYEARR